jgi:hypothetical protein
VRHGQPPRPHRWDLLRPDQLGTLLHGVAEPNLWYLDELTDCAGKVVARSGDADLRFVGRSADSVFDLLGGALASTSWSGRLGQLPLSCAGDPAGLSPRELRRWYDDTATVPARGEHPSVALATAVALVKAGRTRPVRRRLVRTFSAEPAFAEPWLRSLSRELRD